MMAEDLDAHEEVLQLYTGTCKLQICGPLTLAATVQTRNGERALADPGATRDLTTSLAEGVTAHIRELRRRVPGVDTVVVQVDEPATTAVLEGAIPSASGYRRLRAIEPSQAKQLVTQLTASIRAAAAFPVVHSCADDALIDFLAELDVWALSFPVSQPQGRTSDRLGGFFDAGGVWFAGLDVSDVAGSLASVRQVMSQAGVGIERSAGHLVLTPPCGLASSSSSVAVSAYANLVKAARRWVDDPEAR
jgi:methionine synthase II (cobalamin-independent)